MADVSRRGFLGTVAAGAAVIPLTRVAQAAETINPVKPGEDSKAIQAWMKTLADRGEPLVYRGEQLRHVALPLGGIGTGYLALGGRGQLCEWQLFNNVNRASRVADSFFAVRCQGAGAPIARALQLDPVSGLPPVADLTFSGEYPFGRLSIADPALPVQITLTAFNPLIPLNESDSAIPGVIVTLAARNTGPQAVEVSFLASLQNAAGYNGYTRYEGRRYIGYGGNRGKVATAGGLTRVDLDLEPAVGAKLAAPVRMFSFDGDDEMRVIENLIKSGPGRQGEMPAAAALAAANDVIWLDALPRDLGDPRLATVLEAVRLGATLLVTGTDRGLLPLAAAGQALLTGAAKDTDEVVFDDFEHGWANWTLTGNCFGAEPPEGTLPNQQPVAGYQGKRLVNTYVGGDDATGKATSKPFVIQHRFIKFVIGGGNQPAKACLNLLVDGRVVRTATGKNQELLEPASWDVQQYRGREARLEVVDDQTGAWGHLNLDQIVFSNQPSSGLSPEVAQLLCDALPYFFQDVVPVAEGTAVACRPGAPGALRAKVLLAPWLKLVGAQLKPGAQLLASGAGDSPLLVRRRYGRGQVVVYAGLAERGSPRWSGPGRLLGELLALAAGTSYTHGTGLGARHPFRGSLALATDAAGATAQAGWTDAQTLWQDFTSDGRLDPVPTFGPTPDYETHNAAVSAAVTVAPGETRLVRFYLGWHFPHHYRRFWGPPYAIRIGNRYAQRFADAGAVVQYLGAQRERLERETQRFRDALYDSTLPYWVADAVSSQAAILRTQTCLWTEDDFFGGFEGCGGGEGCCPLNCTHVWNYAQAVAALFPGLERRVRREDCGPQLTAEGIVGHRHMYPHTGRPAAGEATDGQCGTILKVWREHLRSADDTFLKEVWPGAKRALVYLLEKRDSDGDGVLDGSQPHTYDVSMTGVSPFIQALWLGALAAGEKMARRMRDDAFAERLHATYTKAAPKLDAMLWNGEYYQQVYNAAGDTRYQHGPGCLSDQLLGQWFAHLLDLGHLWPADKVRRAIRSVFHYNFRESFAGFVQAPRRFAFDNEPGLVICTWPKGGRPAVPLLYSDEVWTGIEYQVAAHLLWEGFVPEGLAVAKAARERYRGQNRNPWNEIECGDNYARAMSSWSLLLAAQGFIYDGPAGRIGFLPRLTPEDHRSLFTAAEGWGRFATRVADGRRDSSITVDWGTLTVREVILPAGQTAEVKCGGQTVWAVAAVEGERLVVRLVTPLTLKAGEVLRLTTT